MPEIVTLSELVLGVACCSNILIQSWCCKCPVTSESAEKLRSLSQREELNYKDGIKSRSYVAILCVQLVMLYVLFQFCGFLVLET